jgi:hypothetical protein
MDFSIEKKPTEPTKEKKSNGTIDENSNSSIISIDGKDTSENIKEDPSSPKRNAKRTVKEKVVKYGTDEEDDDDENQENFHGDESDYVGSDSDTEKIIKKSKPKVKAQVNSTRFYFTSEIRNQFPVFLVT